tara:strand:- start:8428 stop:8766 length:339 start_codon:yes stop_codon:yes gene_type:complete
MSVLDKAIKHYQSLDRIQFHVEEWDVTIYSSKMTVGETAAIQKRATKNGVTDEILMVIYAIIIKAEDAAGEKIFDMTQDTINKLKDEVDRDVVLRIAGKLMESPDMDSIKKK